MRASYQGPNCPSNSCPKCGCPEGYIEGDSWCHIFESGTDGDYDEDWVNQANYTCESDGNGNLYSEQEGDCAREEKETYQCHFQSSETGNYVYLYIYSSFLSDFLRETSPYYRKQLSHNIIYIQQQSMRH